MHIFKSSIQVRRDVSKLSLVRDHHYVSPLRPVRREGTCEASDIACDQRSHARIDEKQAHVSAMLDCCGVHVAIMQHSERAVLGQIFDLATGNLDAQDVVRAIAVTVKESFQKTSAATYLQDEEDLVSERDKRGACRTIAATASKGVRLGTVD